MRSVQVLSTLALKRLVRAAGPQGTNNGTGVPALRKLLPAEQHVSRALRQANARAWAAVEVLLAGEEFWEHAQLTWERSLEGEFFQPLRTFIDKATLGVLADQGLDGRRKAAQALRAALASALLTSGPLELVELLPDFGAADSDRISNDLGWRGPEQLMEHLEKSGYAELCGLCSLRWGDEPLLVVLVAVLFREAVQADPDLFGDLSHFWTHTAADPMLEDLRGLAILLDRHRARLDGLLHGLREPVRHGKQPGAPVDTAAGGVRLKRGKDCAQRGDYDQAIGEYTAALQLHPASADAFVSRADACRLKGEYSQALADYGSALRLEPGNAMVLIQRGQVQWIMGQLAEAITDYTAALQIDPRSAVAYHYRGKALTDAGDMDGALSNFSEALRLDPYYAWAYHDSGEAWTAKGSHDRAIVDFSEAIRLNPLATLSYLRRGDVYLAKREFDRASADYGNVLRLDPHNVLALVSLGIAFREQGAHDQAAAHMTRALELDFANARLYFERGLVFQAMGNHDRALLDFSAAVSRDPKHADACYRRALSHEALGDSQQAMTDLSRAVRLDPNHAAAHNSRGMHYASRGETDLAVTDFNMAIALAPEMTRAYLNRANAYVALGKLDQAMDDCKIALEQEPELSEAYMVRGSVFARQGEYAAAVDDFTWTLRADPLNAQVYYLRGVAFLKQDDRRQAVADLSEAIRLDPNHARAYAQRAAIRKAAGRHDLALSDLAHATRLDVKLAAAYCRQLGMFHESLGMHDCAAADFTVALCLDPKNAAARTGRERAWEAYLKEPRRRSPSSMQQTGGKFPSLMQGADTMSLARPQIEALQAPVGESEPAPTEVVSLPNGKETQKHPALQGRHRTVQETGRHRPVKDTDTHEPMEPVELPASDETVVENADKPTLAHTPILIDESIGLSDTSFKLNVLVDSPTEESESTAARSGAGAAPEYVDDSETEQLKAEPVPDDEEELVIESPADEEQRIKEQEDIARRARLYEEIRKAEAEKSKKVDEEGSKKKDTGKKKKPREEEVFDDGRMPKWKIGVMVAAGLFLLYWIGTFSWGMIRDRNATIKPVPVEVSGSVIGSDGQPLPDVMVRFYPQKAPGLEATAVSESGGKFVAGTFSKTDGVVPGPYIVTVEPRDRKTVAFIPPEYLLPEKSPLKVDIDRSGPNTLKPFKLKL